METIELGNFRTIQDFMEGEGVSRQTVYNWIEDEKLEVKKILNRTLVRFKE